MKKYLKLLLPLAIVIIIGLISWWCYNRFYKDQTTISFKTETVKLEDLTSSISASGTVEPEELINVGAQVSGKIMFFGKDTKGNPVDYGSYVKAGTLLAQIDDELYKAALKEAEAKKLQAQANISSNEAAVSQAEVSIIHADAAITSARAAIKQHEARLKLATSNWVRAKNLKANNAIALNEHDAAEAEFASAQAELSDANAALLRAETDKTRAEAELKRAQASLQHSKAQLDICDAELTKAQRNLEYCQITAPVDGIVIDRRVSEGQTVVSSMNVSSIFLIAKDLKKMEVWVSVNEADIGHIKAGMQTEFTIDTFPGMVFKGVVKRVRLNATMSQNVVTYIVEVTTDNSDGKLIPYLTANVKFIRERRHQVLTVSNAALRFTPAPELIAPAYRDKKFAEKASVVYVQEGEFLRPVEVKTGLRAGGRVELIDPELKEGDVIVYGATEVAAGKDPSGDKSSPFMPKPENNKVRGGGSAANRARAQGK